MQNYIDGALKEFKCIFVGIKRPSAVKTIDVILDTAVIRTIYF